MFNKLKVALKIPSFGKSLLDSQMFTKYTVDNHNSNETYHQLRAFLKSAYILSGGKEIYDTSPVEPSRIEMGVGTYALNLNGMMVIVTTEVTVVKDRLKESACIHVPAIFHKRFESEIDNLFPHNKAPEHFQLTASGNDWVYERSIRSVALVGKIDPTLGSEKPLVEPKVYDYMDKVFDKFINNKQSYIDRNRPYREVVMLYGPPGTGKTSLIRHFNQRYKTHLIEYNPQVKNSLLVKLLTALDGEPAVVLVEELDSYKFLCRTEESSDGDGKASRRINGIPENEYNSHHYTNFINMLDGLVPLKNCIFIFTTNHPDQLRKSVYRMGRANHHIEVGYPSVNTVRVFLGFRARETRWRFLNSLEDKRLPLDAIYRIREAENVAAIKEIIASRDVTLTLADTATYE